VDSGKAHLKITGAEVPEQDWVVVQASVKPYINVFWLGVLILTGGVVVSMGRRVQDLRFWRRRSS
jgi:cytochrome c-type biogenesis protein CcmF